MSLKPAKVQFNGGELSPWLEGRTDIAKYDKTAKLCRNFIPMAEGSLKRRGGTRFVEMTPDDVDVMLKIVPVPAEAVVLINGVERRQIYVARGDKVNFEVSAEGYSSQVGTLVVMGETVIGVSLVSEFAKAVLTINPVPEDAEVKIEGVVRRSYTAPLNKNVVYTVAKNGYKPITERVIMDKNKTVEVTLLPENDEEESGVYGDWGLPLYFVSCSAVGWLEQQKKCFLFRFTNGYLAVIFDANLQAPAEGCERVFFSVNDDGYDSVAFKKGQFYLTCLYTSADAYRYKDLNGNLVAGFTTGLEMKVVGWQLDEEGKYASFYTRYSGSILGTAGRVYYDGDLIWKLVGDFNNG